MPESTKKPSSKLLAMKFMQRSAESERREELEQVQRKELSTSEWRLEYKGEKLQKPKIRVQYEPSYLGFTDTTTLGRKSYQKFNEDLERAEEDQTSEQRLSRETEKEDANTISDKDMVNRMALRLLTKGAAVTAARPMLTASRQTVGAHFVRNYSSEEVEPKKKAASIVDSLPGNSLVSKTGYVTLGAGLATFLISKEIYVFNEETLVLVAFGGLAGALFKYLKEPYNSMADEHINRIKNVLYKARNDHKSAVTERIDQVGQMKDIVDVTKNLFALSRETAKLEAEAFELKQKVAVAQEVKSTLDSWVRYEASVREREQKQLAAFLIEKIQKDLEDPKIQQQILDQAVIDVQKLTAKSA
ncbi:atp4 subunit B of the stator stalk of mitochondrial F1F0 ATP synthase [Umbelopsis nana]